MEMRRRNLTPFDDDGFPSDLYIGHIDSARKNVYNIPTIIGFVIIGSLVPLFVLVFYLDGMLPAPLMIKDEIDYPESFIAERAQQNLKQLTDLGPRIVGSEVTEVHTVNILKDKVNEIILQANKVHSIELDVQATTGSYYLGFKPNGVINVYQNVQNVVVKVNGYNSTSSLLINAHFDSVPTSPGASDDGIMCVVMLEVLRKISQKEDRPTHNIIFLFNGAEETVLQAAHGFITQHKWAKETKVLINLEAAGNGGKEVLFQTGPNVPWLLKYYQKVPHPYGQAAGEEIFQSNIIPSDTDFRIFRDFGNLVGYDFAFARNGYRYHTKFDAFDNIQLGSYQHAGDNVLTLVTLLADAPELEEPKSHGDKNVVYFDIFGFFIISYSHTAAIVINVIVGLVSIGIALYSIWDFGHGWQLKSLKYIIRTLFLIFTGWLTAAGFVYLTSLLLDKTNNTMSWYRQPWLVFGVYAAPNLAILIAFMNIFNTCKIEDKISPNIHAQIQAHLIRMIWTIVLLVATCYGIRSVYALMIPVFFSTICFLLVRLFNLQYTTKKWQCMYYISTIIPTCLQLNQCLMVLTLFIPITGRFGSDKNPELVVGGLTLFFTIITTSFHLPLITVVKKPIYIVMVLLGLFIISVVFIVTPLGFPYSGSNANPTPQRFTVFHTQRTLRDEKNISSSDSGIFMFNNDRNSPNSVKPYVPQISESVPIDKDCDKYLCCGMPLSNPRMLSMLSASTWIPFESPIIQEPSSIELTSTIQMSTTVTRYNFTLTGPDHMTIFLKVKEGSTLVSTSLTDTELEDLVFVNVIWGKQKTDLEFSIDIKTPLKLDGPVIDIVASGKYVHDKPEYRTDAFSQFIKDFPDWADVVAGVATYDSYVF